MKLLSLCIFLSVILLVQGCDSLADKKSETSRELVLTASTPGDSIVLSMLNLDTRTKVDFIRWDLHLINNNTSIDSFSLDINYGISQPNTLGFIGGGELRTLRGRYIILQESGNDIFQLTGENSAVALSFARINQNLYHLLTPDHKLMAGNGGWSYTLNRKDINEYESHLTPVLKTASFMQDDRSPVQIYAGRTPCLELADLYDLEMVNDCIKLKWKLTLNRDPVMLKPTSYRLSRTGHRESEITGTWTTLNGIKSNPEIIIFQLDPDKPDKSLFFMKAGENILFFLDKNLEPMVGDHNFSYTLDKMLN